MFTLRRIFAYTLLVLIVIFEVTVRWQKTWVCYTAHICLSISPATNGTITMAVLWYHSLSNTAVDECMRGVVADGHVADRGWWFSVYGVVGRETLLKGRSCMSLCLAAFMIGDQHEADQLCTLGPPLSTVTPLLSARRSAYLSQPTVTCRLSTPHSSLCQSQSLCAFQILSVVSVSTDLNRRVIW